MHNSNNFVVCNNTQAAELRGGGGPGGSQPPPYFFRADKSMHFCLVAAKNSAISQSYLLYQPSSLLLSFSATILPVFHCCSFKFAHVSLTLNQWVWLKICTRTSRADGHVVMAPSPSKSFHHLCNKVIYLCYYYLCLTQPPALLIHQ